MALTASMYPYIEQSKNNWMYIIDSIIKESPGIDMNLWFIGYRDIEEELGGECINIEFTKYHIEVRDIINCINRGYGEDIPEDVEWAFEIALLKNWKVMQNLLFL